MILRWSLLNIMNQLSNWRMLLLSLTGLCLFATSNWVAAQSYAPGYYPAGKVINGERVSPKGSAVAQLRVDDGGAGEVLCTGTFITTDTVLTAAHCLEGRVRRVTVIFNGKRYSAARYRKHPSYRSNDVTGLLDSDVALITLPNKLPVVPERVIISGLDSVNTAVEFYGYGQDERGRTTLLRRGRNTIREERQGHFTTLYTGAESTTCNGDSGGPGFMQLPVSGGKSIRGIAGVVSTGTEQFCGVGDTTYFVSLRSVSSFLRRYAPRAKYR